MRHRNHGGDGEAEFIAEGHVHQNTEERQHRGDDARLLDLLADGGSDRVHADALELGFRKRLLEHFFGLQAGILGSRDRQIIALGRSSTFGLILDSGLADAALGKGLANLFSLHPLREAHLQLIATGELNTEHVVTSDEHAVADAHHDEQPRGDERRLGEVQEPDVGTLDDVQHRQGLDNVLGEEEVENQPGDHQGREHRDAQTNGQSHTEALDRTRAHDDQQHRRDQRRQVGIEDRSEGLVITRRDGTPHRLAGGQLLTHALVNKNVGIHRHTDGQHDTSDTWQGEGDIQGAHDSEHDQDVEEQSHVGDESGRQVVDDHERRHTTHAQQRGHLARCDGVGTQ